MMNHSAGKKGIRGGFEDVNREIVNNKKRITAGAYLHLATIIRAVRTVFN